MPVSPLLPQTAVSRRLSATEYYHACVGQSPHTLEPPREITFIVEGSGAPSPAAWQAALQQVCRANPGCQLQLTGRRRHACWRSDGPPPRLRFVDDCTWDGSSDRGAGFIRQEPLALVGAPGLELTIVGGHPTRVVVRVLHAMMDGIGVMHFLQELFRALRGETLLGSNAGFSDVDLMRSIPGARRSAGKPAPACLGGSGRSEAGGDSWRRLSLSGPQPDLLARTALTVAEFARRHGTQPVRIAVPVNLRRHCPGLLSTLNFSSMLHVDIDTEDGTAEFRARLTRLLGEKTETDCPALLDAVRWLPLHWLDRLLSRTPANYRRRRLLETAVLSNLGRYPAAALSGGGFVASRLFGIPLGDNACGFLFSVDDRTDICFGMANVYAADGRLDAFMSLLGQRLG